jgi:hypothetical protein
VAWVARFHLWRRAMGYDQPFKDAESLQGDGIPMLGMRTLQAIAVSGVMPADLHAQLRQALESSSGLPRHRQIGYQILAEMQFAVGQPNEAFDALRSAVDFGFADLAWAHRCPLIERWRDDPRWALLYETIRGRARGAAEAWTTAPQRPRTSIEVDDALREQQVTEIADTDFFKQLQVQARALRQKPGSTT